MLKRLTRNIQFHASPGGLRQRSSPKGKRTRALSFMDGFIRFEIGIEIEKKRHSDALGPTAVTCGISA